MYVVCVCVCVCVCASLSLPEVVCILCVCVSLSLSHSLCASHPRKRAGVELLCGDGGAAQSRVIVCTQLGAGQARPDLLVISFLDGLYHYSTDVT